MAAERVIKILAAIAVMGSILSLTAAEPPVFEHYLIGHIYTGSNHFQGPLYLQVKGGVILDLQKPGQDDLPFSIDFSNFWAVPALSLPLQFVQTTDDSLLSGPVNTECLIDDTLLTRIRKARGCEAQSIYLHYNPLSSSPALVVKYLPGSNDKTLRPVLFDVPDAAWHDFERFYQSLKQYIFFAQDDASIPYSTDIFSGSSLKHAWLSASRSHLQICRYFSPGARTDLTVRDSLVSADKMAFFFPFSDSLLSDITLNPDCFFIFPDFPAYFNYAGTGSCTLPTDRILIRDCRNWQTILRSHPTLPVLDIMSRNVNRFYEGPSSPEPLSVNAAASMLIFDGNPFAKGSRIVYTMNNGQCKPYADPN